MIVNGINFAIEKPRVNKAQLIKAGTQYAIVKTPFPIPTNTEVLPNISNLDYDSGFCLFNAKLLRDTIPNKLRTNAYAVLAFLMTKVKIGSNVIVVTARELIEGLGKTSYYGQFIENLYVLIESGIVAKTNQRSTYIINHNIIFKGNLADFAKEYNDKFGNEEVLYDDKGNVILELV